MLSKLQNNLILNITLLVLTCIVPIYVFQSYQNDINIDLIQKVVFTILLCGSLLLTYINNKNRAQMQNLKWLWILFEILGIIGIVYSLIIIWLIFTFSRGIGF